jgi:enamine deaminase RidA (YjgF/YER057c/UK114 family)
MHKLHNPPTAVAPFGRYAQAVEAAPGLRWLFLAGQVGVTPDGKTGESFEGQARAAFANVKALLADAGMDFGDVVKMNVYLTSIGDAPDYRKVREEFMGDVTVASTLVVVAGLARPEWRIEVEAIAAKA